MVERDDGVERIGAYNDRGNMTKIGNLAANPLTFIYDMADRPISVIGTNRKGEAVTGGSYAYDGNMKRVKAVTNGVTRHNVYDLSGKLIHVKESAGDTFISETDYLHAAGMTLARIRSVADNNGVFTYMHPDHLGSASVGTDAEGAVTFTEFYTPYGEALASVTANDNQSDFTGHIRDKDIGMSYMQARYMDPNFGRFLSIDPVTFLDNGNPSYFNRYRYCSNDPINCTDPTGKSDAFGTTDSILFELVAYAFQPVIDALDPRTIPDDIATTIDEVKSGDLGGAALTAGGVVIKPLKGAKGALKQSKGSKPKRKQVFSSHSTRKKAKDARPRPLPVKSKAKGGKQVTRQTKNQNGTGNRPEKHDNGSRHFHDDRHNDKV